MTSTRSAVGTVLLGLIDLWKRASIYVVFAAMAGACALLLPGISVPAYAQNVSFAGVQTTVGSGLKTPGGVAVDGAGDVFIADTYHNRVVEVPAGGGAQTVLTVSVGGVGLNMPYGVAVDGAGDVFIADTLNSRVVEVPAGGGAQTTVPASGPDKPFGVAVDGAGDVFIADNINNRVVEVPAGGGAQTTVGTGLSHPNDVAVDGAGDVFISDNNNRVVEVQRSQPPTLSFAATPLGNTSTDSPQSVTVQNIGNQLLEAVSPGLTIGSNSFVQVTGPGAPADCTSTFSLAAGASCNLSIDFTPQTIGTIPSAATFTDNALNAATVSQIVTLQGPGTPATTTVGISAPSVTYPANGSVTVTVTSLWGTVTGNVSLSVDGGSAVSQALSNGSTTFTVTGLTGGSHTLSASYAAQGDFAASANTGALQVNKANSKTTITGMAPDPSTMGQAVKVSFSVVAVPAGGTPIGNVTVSDGVGDSCTAPATSLSCSISFAAAGKKTVTASFAGDTNFNPSASATVTQTVMGYSVAASPKSQSIPGGGMAMYQVTLTSVLGFKGDVRISCGELPTGAKCILSDSVWLGPSASVSNMVVIETSRETPRGAYTPEIIATCGNPATGGANQSTTVTLAVK